MERKISHIIIYSGFGVGGVQHQGIICTSPAGLKSIESSLLEPDKFILGGCDEDYLGGDR